MMLGAIPNPKKTIAIDFPIAKVKEALYAVSAVEPKYKTTSINEVLNIFTFEATELLSLGVYIDINLSGLSETKTEITIEVRRKVGSFDQSHEVTNANKHIQNLLMVISKVVVMDKDSLEKMKADVLAKPKGGCGKTAVFLILFFVGLLYVIL